MSRRLLLAPALLLVGLGCNRSTPTTDPQASPTAASASAAPAPVPSVAAAPSNSVPRQYGVRGTEDEFARPRPPNDNPKIVRISQILIAYQGAEQAPAKVTRSRDAARELALHVGLQGRVGAPFEDLVKKYSDDPSAATNHGDLGPLTRDQLAQPLSDAAFHLFKQEVGSEPVETPSGFHILKRTE